jgi:hypothetical protein
MRLIAMKILPISASVLLGLAGVAAAQLKHEENNERLSYNGQGAQKRDKPAVVDGWLQLSTPTPAKHGTEFLMVGKDLGAFDKVRIDAEGGKVIVRRVKIIFDDGKQRVVDVDRVLDPKHKSAVIELGGPKEIDRIVITTEPQTKGSYALYGSSPEGVVTR